MNRRKFINQTGKAGLSMMVLSIAGELVYASVPKAGKPVLSGQPCRNFNILARTSVIDPKDNREKFLLSNYADGETGNIILIDIKTGKGENFPLPIGAGAWGLVNYHNNKIIVGTCTDQAYLHVFDLKKREWAKPIVSEGESYFWQMGLASDNKVYGGTYPGCTLTQYDPATNGFKNLGKVSDNPENQYSRPVYCQAPGYVFVWYGFNTKGIKVYHLESGKLEDFGQPDDVIKEVNEAFIAVQTKTGLAFYDAKTLKLLPAEGYEAKMEKTHIKIQNGEWCSFITLKNGQLAGVRGQDYFITDAPENYSATVNVTLKRIPVEAPPTTIMSITHDEQGKIWGSCGFGQTIFSFDPKTKKYWNSAAVCKNGGEVYGMVFVNKQLHLSAYVGGDLMIYDPARPWNQLENKNPKLVGTVGPDLIRPEAKSVLGPDGNVWTGWSAKYGVYGGGLSSVNPVTQEVRSWYDPIPGQQLTGITADHEYIYFTTNGHASGLPYNENIQCHFVVWKPGIGVVKAIPFEKGIALNRALLAIDGLVAFSHKKELSIYDPAKKEIVKTIQIGDYTNVLIRLKKDILGFFTNEVLTSLNLKTGKMIEVCKVPGEIGAATVLPDGTVYYTCKSKLYSLKQG
jgi:hypothetical protein